jgi:hypothetical protein
VRLDGLGKLKKSTSSGLDPATFRLVAECLDQLRYRVPPSEQLQKQFWLLEAPSLLIPEILKELRKKYIKAGKTRTFKFKN